MPVRAGVALEFPGLIGPGLIEAGPPEEELASGLEFPGLIGPGLIEAIETGGGESQLTREFPGLIGPGLIEAGRTFSRSDTLVLISRADRPGPH